MKLHDVLQKWIGTGSVRPQGSTTRAFSDYSLPARKISQPVSGTALDGNTKLALVDVRGNGREETGPRKKPEKWATTDFREEIE
jgi:hypothetical protein